MPSLSSELLDIWRPYSCRHSTRGNWFWCAGCRTSCCGNPKG